MKAAVIFALAALAFASAASAKEVTHLTARGLIGLFLFLLLCSREGCPVH